MKFKIGDKVKVRSDLSLNERYYMADRSGSNSVTLDMFGLRGKTVTISGYSLGQYKLAEPEMWERWVDEMFEPIALNKIVITTDGVTTLARLYDGKKVVKSAEAKCSPSDAFNFNTGAQLAYNRLMYGTDYHPAEVAFKPEPPKPKYYSGKVVCVAKEYKCFLPLPDFTVGKIYTVVDGAITDDTGYRSKKYTTLEDICTAMGNAFIPYLGEA